MAERPPPSGGATEPDRLAVTLLMVSCPRSTAAETRAALRQATGVEPPEGPRRAGHDAMVILGVGPDRWLVVVPGERAFDDGPAARIAAALHGLALVTDQSDARAVFRVPSFALPGAAERLLAIDLDPRAFPDDGAAVTEAAGMSAIVWRDGVGLLLAVPRSMEADAAHHVGLALRAEAAARAQTGRP